MRPQEHQEGIRKIIKHLSCPSGNNRVNDLEMRPNDTERDTYYRDSGNTRIVKPADTDNGSV